FLERRTVRRSRAPTGSTARRSGRISRGRLRPPPPKCTSAGPLPTRAILRRSLARISARLRPYVALPLPAPSVVQHAAPGLDAIARFSRPPEAQQPAEQMGSMIAGSRVRPEDVRGRIHGRERAHGVAALDLEPCPREREVLTRLGFLDGDAVTL